MKPSHLALAAILALGLSSLPAHAGLSVDWLTYAAGPDRTHFSLVDDAGAIRAQAELQLQSGVLAPLLPGGGNLAAPFWVGGLPFDDSVTGTMSVATTRLQVAPQGGAARYQLTLTGADLSGWVFGVGQLFGSGSGGTRELNVSALGAGGLSAPVNFLGTHAWDDGVRLYTQPLAWDAALGRLAFNATTTGESAFAFFDLPATGSPVTRLTFQVPNGFNGATGDALEFAFAAPAIPEPTSAIFGIGVLSFCLSSRRRGRR